MQEGYCLFACGVRSKTLIRNVLLRSVVKCSSSRLKGQEDTPQTVRISPLVGWPYCAEVTPHIGQALRPKTHSILCRGDASQPIGLIAYSTVSLGNLCAG